MITKEQILNTIEAALDAMVERYNESNDREVGFIREDGETGSIFTVDGGNVDGAFEVTVSVEPL